MQPFVDSVLIFPAPWLDSGMQAHHCTKVIALVSGARTPAGAEVEAEGGRDAAAEGDLDADEAARRSGDAAASAKALP